MEFITFKEIFYFAILTLAIGYIFTGIFVKRPRTVWDRMHPKKVKLEDFKFAAIVAAPAIILHELAHKFVAMGFGFNATFELFSFGLILGVFLKAIGSPFLIIAPGYVTISQAAFSNAMAYRLIAFAGPLTNLILWGISKTLLKKLKKMNMTQRAALLMSQKVNILLFFFNMIPFGPFDGAKVFFGPPS
ncbi:M50 family metallopeptidase [Candidatus Woesearchaeota archaeon]|jgi:Zn-dependent protease|nr:M50 family metallopeptidase [Candidatus Woesearchaeota archaeon]MBT4835471.1 M50 family metallopeptidase [Candidatus Woesearchaeota archaeon]MBT6734837.1 M50 family metallopeptidase [Candidatus Woesearchaeota archaeon]MBT7169648.1 M50 family metallopeptidase [Candidatus Woesearchaeota archaeon]MBT7474606.1 M50 family metallopeptidase [Candidatus Woesearchaeota archaeon]